MNNKSTRIVSEVDKQAARELCLFAENTEELYDRVLVPVIKNLQRKVKKGIYDKTKALIAFLHVIDEAAKLYDNWYGSGRNSLRLFDKATRMEAARQLMDRCEDDVFQDVEIESSKQIKSGYAPYFDDSVISDKGKKAYKWLCKFVGQKLKLSDHPWYGPTVYLNINKMNITEDMLEEINNKFFEMSDEWGYNSIVADSGSWGWGNVYEVNFDKKYNTDSSRKPVKSSLENSNDKTLFSKSLNQLSNENALEVDFKVLGVPYVLMLNTPNSMHENEIIIVNHDTGAIDIVQKEDYDLPLYQLMSQDFLIDFEPSDTEITKVDYNKIKSSVIKSSFNYYDGFEDDVRYFAEQYSDEDDIVELVAGDIENDHPTESPEEFDSLMRAVHEELKRQGYFKAPWVNSSRINSSKEDKADEDGPHMKFKTLDEDTKFELREQIEDELEALLDKLNVKFTTDVWEETVQYILSFFEEDNAYNPRTAKQAVHEWYLDTKDDFPEMFDSKKQKVASARYCEWIRSKRLIRSAKKFFK